MGKRFSQFILAVGMLLTVLWSVQSVAQPALRSDMIQSLESLQQRLSQGDAAGVASQARQSAARLEGGNAADRWARALFLQLAANAEARQGNDALAADLFAEARSAEAADEEQRNQWLHQESRLRLRAGQNERGAKLLSSWLEQAEGRPEDYWLMAQAFSKQQRWEDAATWVDRARDASGTIDSNRLSFAASIYQRAGRDDTALDMLDSLLSQGSQNADTWRRAAALAQRLEMPGRAAALWEAAWRQDILNTDEDLLQLVRLHIAGGTPARAAEKLAGALEEGRLERDQETLRLLAEAWTAAKAQDQAFEAWRDVAERSGNGQDWRRLGELAYEWGRWQIAAEALDQAQASGMDDSRVWLLEGIARMELGEDQSAREAFEKARDAGSAQAEAWLTALGEQASDQTSAPEERG